jgi:hypothetical protein
MIVSIENKDNHHRLEIGGDNWLFFKKSAAAAWKPTEPLLPPPSHFYFQALAGPGDISLELLLHEHHYQSLPY